MDTMIMTLPPAQAIGSAFSQVAEETTISSRNTPLAGKDRRNERLDLTG